MRPHVHGQLLEPFEIEVRIAEDFRGRFAEKGDCPLDQIVIRAVCRLGIPNIDGDRAKPLVRIGLHLPSIFQYRNRAIADEVVQPVERAADNPLTLIPGRSLFEDGFDHPRQEKWLPKIGRLQVKQQIGVVPPIGRQALLEHELDDGRRLRRISKSRHTRLQAGELAQEEVGEGRVELERVRPRKECVPIALKGGVRFSAGEIQISQDFAK